MAYTGSVIETMSCDITTNGFQPTAGYVVGPSGEQLTEVDGSGNWRHTNVYAGGKQIGTYDGNVSAPTLHFYFDDPLGTRRAQTNSSGVLEATYQSLPFGDGLAQNPVTTTDDPTENHFTGKERDTETGNDYMFARYYNSATGRFLSPDWSVKVEPVPYSKLDDPQSLNLYAYVGNNPMDKVDPDGHTPEDRVNEALKLTTEKIPYIPGGGHSANSDPKNGLDCSGLVMTAFKADPDNKMKVDGTASDIKKAFQEKGEHSDKMTDAKPGDAIFFTKGKGDIDHAGIVSSVTTSTDKKGVAHEVIKFVDAPNPTA